MQALAEWLLLIQINLNGVSSDKTQAAPSIQVHVYVNGGSSDKTASSDRSKYKWCKL